MPALDTARLFPALDTDCLLYLLSHCSFPTLCRLRSTCTSADEFVANEMRFRVDTGLRTFFDKPDLFLGLLLTTDSVVSGSLAVKVLSGATFPPRDLDVYTTAESAKRVLDFLQDCGYKLSGSTDPYNPEYRGGIKRILHLARGQQSVDLVLSVTQSATLPIVHFWSTTVQVFFGGRGFCVCYPRLLERNRGLLNPGRICMDRDRLDDLVTKYEKRGFNIRENEAEFVEPGEPPFVCQREQSATCSETIRSIGDAFCLQSAFGTVAQRRTTTAFSGSLANLTNVWWRGGLGCGATCSVGVETVFDAWTLTSGMVGTDDS